MEEAEFGEDFGAVCVNHCSIEWGPCWATRRYFSKSTASRSRRETAPSTTVDVCLRTGRRRISRHVGDSLQLQAGWACSK